MSEMKEYLAQRGMSEIDVDSQFKFHCTQCGNCCRNRDDIILSPKDLFKLAVELKQDIKSVVEQYCEQYIGRDSRLSIAERKCMKIPFKKCSYFTNCLVQIMCLLSVVFVSSTGRVKFFL